MLQNLTSSLTINPGCPGSEDVDFTILSQYLNNSMFQWTIDGTVKLIPDLGILDWFQDNEVVLDEEQAFGQLVMEEKCEKGNCKDMPPTMKLTIRAAYGSAFLKGTFHI